VFTLVLRLWPGVNFGTTAAAILMASPVRGLRPSRAARALVWNVPNPTKTTLSPSAICWLTVSMKASSILLAAALEHSLFVAMASINSVLFIVYNSKELMSLLKMPRKTACSKGFGLI